MESVQKKKEGLKEIRSAEDVGDVKIHVKSLSVYSKGSGSRDSESEDWIREENDLVESIQQDYAPQLKEELMKIIESTKYGGRDDLI